MSDINYSTPYCEIIVGGKSIERKVVRAIVQSSRADPSATCEVVLDNRNLDFNGLTRRDDELEINMGYWDIGRWPVFSGTVQDVSAEADYAIYGKDKMKLAHTTRIVKAFEDVTPNDVITYCVNEAGFESSDLGGGDLPQKKHFVLRNTTVTQAIALVERTWGITGWGITSTRSASSRGSRGRTRARYSASRPARTSSRSSRSASCGGCARSSCRG